MLVKFLVLIVLTYGVTYIIWLFLQNINIHHSGVAGHYNTPLIDFRDIEAR